LFSSGEEELRTCQEFDTISFGAPSMRLAFRTENRVVQDTEPRNPSNNLSFGMAEYRKKE
jgi:hypothetical protein